jgi:hypothetical protein
MRHSLMALALLAMSCSGVTRVTVTPSPPAQTGSTQVVVTVYRPCVLPQDVAAGIEVFAVAATGEVVPLGKTTQMGRVWLSREKLRSLHPSVVLFCYPGDGPCTSYFVGPGRLDLAAYDAFSIDLPEVIYR